MVLLSLLASALAAPLAFTPDRPGVGDSTGTVGAGHAMVEGGLAVAPAAPASVGLAGWTGRFGVDDGVELRLHVPDLGVGQGLSVGTVGLGAKVAGATGDRWSVSVVPAVQLDPTSGAVSGSVGANTAVGLGAVGVWAHATASQGPAGTGLFSGLGVSAAVGDGGLYAHGGGTVAADGFAGLGGWWGVGEALQLDLAADLVGLGATVAPLLGVGVSAGW